MKYFKDPNNIVFAYELDCSQDDFIPEDQTPITEDEADELRKTTPTIESLLIAIEAEKKQIKDGGFILDDILFDSDNAAQIAYLQVQVKLSLNPSYTTQWKASSGVWVTMDVTLFAKIMTAIEEHSAKCFAWQEAKENEIAVCTTIEELEAVSLNFGEE